MVTPTIEVKEVFESRANRSCLWIGHEMYGKVRKQGQDFGSEPEHLHKWRLHLLNMNLEEKGMLDMEWVEWAIKSSLNHK